MPSFDKINEYCKLVCQQIRFKRARGFVETEIKNHIIDQRDAYLSSGQDDLTATENAILQMGDAVEIGQQFDKTHKPCPQYLMIFLVGVFMVLGALVNHFINENIYQISFFPYLRYLFAFLLFLICYFVDFSLLGKFPKTIYFLTVLTPIILMFTSSETIHGRLVFELFSIIINPIYFSLLFPLCFALFVYSQRNKGHLGIIFCFFAYLPFAFILMTIPSFINLIIYSIVSLFILLFAIIRNHFGTRKKYALALIILIIIFIALSLIFLFSYSNYLQNRLFNYLNPVNYLDSSGYIYYTIRKIIANSSFIGGNNSINNDFDIYYPFTELINHFGLITFVIITCLLLFFSFISIYKVLKEKSALGSLIALSIILTFVFNSFFYLLDTLGYGTMSASFLPFIFDGNLSLIINSALMGFMLSVFRTGEVYKDNFLPSFKASQTCDFIIIDDGKLILNFKSFTSNFSNRFKK